MFKKEKVNLYNLSKIVNTIKEENTVYIVQEKKYADILGGKGFAATIANNILFEKEESLKEYCSCFTGAYVVILLDNSEMDKDFIKHIKNKLKNYAYAIKVVVIKDIKNYLSSCNVKENLKSFVKSEEWKYARWIKVCKDDSVKINAGVLAELIKQNLNFILVGDISNEKALIYVYEGGVYKEISKLTLKNYIKDYITRSLRSSYLINNVSDLMIMDDIQDSNILKGKEEIINLKNGLYNVKTKELKKHTEKYISRVQINIEYNERAQNYGHWDNFINTLTNRDVNLVKVIQEWCGLVLSNYRGCLVKKSLIMLGKGNTGKSKFLDILIHLVGVKNTAQISMQRLGHRFALSRIQNVRIIHNADLPTKLVEDESLAVFKQLTGGDASFIEGKCKDGVDIFYDGVLIYCANKLPAICGDVGDHLFDRFVIIPCNNVVPVEKRDPNLLDKLKLDSSYIFNWAMIGLERLISNNFKFTIAQKCEIERVKFAVESDSVRAFISEFYDVTENRKDRIKSSILYNEYTEWCKNNGYHSCSNREFKNRLEQNLCIKYNKKYDGNPNYEYIKKKELTEIENDYIPF